jgi:hypothetical protein
MRIYWPCIMDLPSCTYEVLEQLHGKDLKVNCEKTVRWQELDSLAEYLKRNGNREGWIYTQQHIAQIEIAARTGVPFRVLDFFDYDQSGHIELAAVVEVHGREREILFVNPFFKRDHTRTTIRQGISLH